MAPYPPMEWPPIPLLVAGGDGSEILVDIFNQFPGGEIGPIAGKRRVGVEASFVQGVLTCNDQNKWTDFLLTDSPVENHLHVGTDAIRTHETMEIVDGRKPFVPGIVIGWKVN